MDYKVMGIRPVNYVSKKTGREVKGTELHCNYVDEKIVGTGVKIFYIPQRCECHHVQIGDTVHIYFNEFGNPDFIQVL